MYNIKSIFDWFDLENKNKKLNKQDPHDLKVVPPNPHQQQQWTKQNEIRKMRYISNKCKRIFLWKQKKNNYLLKWNSLIDDDTLIIITIIIIQQTNNTEFVYFDESIKVSAQTHWLTQSLLLRTTDFVRVLYLTEIQNFVQWTVHVCLGTEHSRELFLGSRAHKFYCCCFGYLCRNMSFSILFLFFSSVFFVLFMCVLVRVYHTELGFTLNWATHKLRFAYMSCVVCAIFT